MKSISQLSISQAAAPKQPQLSTLETMSSNTGMGSQTNSKKLYAVQTIETFENATKIARLLTLPHNE